MTRAFNAAWGMVEGSFDFDFADLPLEWQGDLIEWVNRTLKWRDQQDVVLSEPETDVVDVSIWLVPTIADRAAVTAREINAGVRISPPPDSSS